MPCSHQAMTAGAAGREMSRPLLRMVCGAAVALVGLLNFARHALGPVPTLAVMVLAGVGLVYMVLRFGYRSLHDEILRLFRHKHESPAAEESQTS